MTDYVRFRLAELLAAYLPIRFAYWTALRMADLHHRSDGTGRAAVMSNLRRIHARLGHRVGDGFLRRSARTVYQNFGKYLVDFFHYPRRLRAADLDDLICLERADVLEAVLARGRGAVLLTGHIGNWEMAAGLLAGLGYPLNVVALPMAERAVNRLFMERRAARGVRVIPHSRAARPCLEALRRNELVGILGDRDFTISRETTPLFGAPARLPRGPARLAQVSGAPIVPIFCSRVVNDLFDVRLDDPIEPPAGRADLGPAMVAIAAALERAIGACPEQWFVFHDFWNVDADLAVVRRDYGTRLQIAEEMARGE